jgi:hypothetical protein
MESLSGSPSSVMIWSRFVYSRRGGLAGEDGGLRRWVGGCGGGVGDLLCVRDGVCILGPRAAGLGHGGSLCFGGGSGGCVVSARRKMSRAASPPRMARICIGPCGEGANCTLHLVYGGRRSAVLGLPLGCLVAVAACMRGVGTSESRRVISVMIKPCVCCVWASWRVQSSGSHWTRNSSAKVDLLLCLIRRGAHRSRIRLMPALSPLASLPRRI